MGKSSRSFSIDDDLADRLSSRQDMNASAVVNSLLRDYLEAGRSADVALHQRREKLEREEQEVDSKISRLQTRKQQIQRELEQVNRQIEERRSAGVKQVGEVVEMYERGEFRMEQLKPDNGAIQNYAGRAQMTPERFISEVRDRIEDGGHDG